ncbi:MAG: exonuclease SbcCD subunit D [Treponema sp.]|jgi:exonuclease SbcD|nr:exonuclease SbcCD subunit D [Treponema sp.]
MKLLHLSDLHTGKSVNGFSMLEEQKRVFNQIAGFIQTERPNAVIIAGDVYDRAVPGVEAVRMFDDFLTDLAGQDVTVMIIAGNHDSPERLSYASRLLRERRLHIYGAFDGTLRRVTLNDEYGEIHFWLLPFIRPAAARDFFPDREIDTCAQAVAAVIDSAEIDWDVRNVLVSHQFYTMRGVTPQRSESEIDPVGGLDAVDASVISRFDYAALGHLHGAQQAGGTHIRYAGSPLKYSFSECRHKKSAALVELREKGSLTVSALPFIPVHDMREIKGSLDTLLGDEFISRGNCGDYLKVILTDEEEIIDPMGKIRSVYPNVMVLSFENSRASLELSANDSGSGTGEGLSPYDLFSNFFLERTGMVMNSGQEKIVRELLETGGRQ